MNYDVKEICDRLLDGPVPPLRSGDEVIGHARRARRRRKAVFASVGTGLAVIAVIAAATAIPLGGESGSRADPGFGGPRASSAPPSPAPSASATPPRSLDLGTKVRSVEVSTVVAEMAMKAAQVQPLTIPDGQYLYVRAQGWQPPHGQLHEMWLEQQGMIAIDISISSNDPTNPLRKPREPTSANSPVSPAPMVGDDEVRRARERFRKDGPSLWSPTPQWLATLPTDPTLLLQMVDKLNEQTKLGGERYEFKEITELFHVCGAVLTPAVRAAFYRALGKISGLTATELRVDGRRMYALRTPENGEGFADELLLDLATGEVAGVRNVANGSPSSIELWHYAVVAKAGATG